MFATRWIVPFVPLVLLGLALAACASKFSEAQAEWPPMPAGKGRIVFLGDNYGWYGPFEGGAWNPVIAIDGHTLAVDHDEGVCFAAEVPSGKRHIAVDGQDALKLVVEPNKTKYVEMQRTIEKSDDFGIRAANYRLLLVQVDEAYAKARLDQLEFLGLAR